MAAGSAKGKSVSNETAPTATGIPQDIASLALLAIPDPVLVLKASDQIIFYNPVAAALFDLPEQREGAVSLADLELSAQLEDPESAAQSWQKWSANHAHISRLRFLHDPRWFRPILSILPDDRQLLLLHDVTVEAEADLRLEDLRREFLSAAAHKFTTPLTAIKLYVHLIKSSEHKKDAASPMLNPLGMLDHHLTRFALEVNEVMDIAQLRSGGKLSLNAKPVDVVALTKKVIDDFKQHRSDRVFEFESAMPFLVGVVDQPRFEQVVRQLVDNADRYSLPNTAVRVMLSEVDGGPRLEFIDQGVGIPLEAQKQLFTPYFRAENVKTLRLGTGLGLGLFLCRGILEQHFGSLEVLSTEGEGTRVVAQFPSARRR